MDTMDSSYYEGSSGSSSSHDTPNIGNTKAASLPTNTQLFNRVRLSQQQHSLPLSQIQKYISFIPNHDKNQNTQDGDLDRKNNKTNNKLSTDTNNILNLGLSQHATTLSRRFRSLSNYSSFQPQALDCFTSSSLSNSPSCNSNANVPYTSIGAMASTKSGILLIPIASKPYEPLLILQHCIPNVMKHPIHHTTTYSNQISCLKFQASSSSTTSLPKLLASASTHSPSVLIWDISGQCMNPLLRRLDTPMDTSIYNNNNNIFTSMEYPSITSVAWNVSGQGIFASGLDFISMWDLRCWAPSSLSSGTSRGTIYNTNGGIINTTSNRPNQRWGTSNNNNIHRTYISVVTSKQSEEHWIGTLDSSGVVRFFDDRFYRNKDSTHHDGATTSFAAHSMGVGLEYFVSSKNKNTFMTWGMEENRNTTVKIWQQKSSVSDTSTFIDDENIAFQSNVETYNYECISKIKQKSLSCARVCPVSEIDAIVTIQTEDGTWSASVWTVQGQCDETSSFNNTDNLGANLVTTFGGLNENMIPQVMENEPFKNDNLIAAELTIGVCPDRSHTDDLNIPRETEILLCSVTTRGYLSTHAITEFSGNLQNIDTSVAQQPITFNLSSKLDKTIRSSTKLSSQIGDINDKNQLFSFRHDQRTTPEDIIVDPARLDPYPQLANDLQWLDDDVFPGSGTSSLFLDESMNAGIFNVEGVSLNFDFVRDSVEQLPLPADFDTGSGIIAVTYPSLSTQTIDPYKALRVPSPRLCGAVFTLEKLAVFTNGPVMKAWSWFVTDRIAKNESSSTRLDQLDECHDTKAYKYLQNESEMIDTHVFIEYYDHKKLSSAESPHTFWDFLRMKEAVKALHLENDSRNAGGTDYASNNYASMMERSDSTSSSSDQEDDSSDDSNEFRSTHILNESDTMLSCHFDGGSSKKAMIRLSAHLERPQSPQQFSPTPITRPMISLNTECPVAHNFISPLVFIKTESIALCHQSSKLAEMWHLGSWEVENRDVSETESFSSRTHGNIASTLSDRKENDLSCLNVDRNTTIKRNGSMIGNLKTVINQNGNPLTSVPSDQRFMQRGRQMDIEVFQPYHDSSQNHSLHKNKSSFMVELKPSEYIRRRLQQVHEICIHNSMVSRLLGYPDKADIWDLLALIVDNVMNGKYDDFDGWIGLAGSIGVGLISKILKLLEDQGDVQMLATIICVFCGGRENHRKTSASSARTFRSLLLPDEDVKFDNFILLYASILYRWGLLGKRTELNKHIAATDLLSYHIDIGDGDQHQTSFHDMKLLPLCSKCSKSTDADTNICKDCRGFAFRCAVCMNPVRGLFIICKDCGHGGHVKHIVPWFDEFKMCPTGCGCLCIYESFV